jgi:hypothetical protein
MMEQAAKSDSCARRPKNLWLAAFVGMDLGVLGGAAYLFLGGAVVFGIPLWAELVFYPGFWVGFWAYDHWHLKEGAAALTGLITVGLAYAAIAVLIRLAWNFARRRHQK